MGRGRAGHRRRAADPCRSAGWWHDQEKKSVARPGRTRRHRTQAVTGLDVPGPGAVALGAVNFGGPSMVALNFYLYGDQAARTVAHETPLWEAWFQNRFPMRTEPRNSN